jgi:spore coat protein U-like protein
VSSRLPRTLVAALALLLAAWPLAGVAGSNTGNLNVSASIAGNCIVNTGTMATGSISVTCTQNAPVTIALNTGLNPTHASGTTRAMANSTYYLSYELYTSSARTTVWNTSNTVSATGTGSAQTVSVYGTIPAGQGSAQPAGSYTDTVGITLTF